MMPVIPGINTLWYFFQSTKAGRESFGTPMDCAEKFKFLERAGLLSEGAEFFLMPEKLKDADEFNAAFYKSCSGMNYKTVHIGSARPDFLLASDKVFDKLRVLSEILDRLETDAVIVHAHHLRRERLAIKKLLDAALPSMTVLVENDAPAEDYGSGIDDLMEIFGDLPDYRLCLDICHVGDSADHSVDDFMSESALNSRIGQIHFSCSMRLVGKDLYTRNGYAGYEPDHALWSIAGMTPARSIRELISRYPVVLEGIVPREDKSLSLLAKEMSLLRF